MDIMMKVKTWEQQLELGGRLEMEGESEVSRIMPRFLEKIRFEEGDWWFQFAVYDAIEFLLRFRSEDCFQEVTAPCQMLIKVWVKWRLKNAHYIYWHINYCNSRRGFQWSDGGRTQIKISQ